jgi:polar amino acid transport system substrate-binding protein
MAAKAPGTGNGLGGNDGADGRAAGGAAGARIRVLPATAEAAAARGRTARPHGRGLALLKAAALGGLALTLAAACSAGTALVGAHPSAPSAGLGSVAPKVTSTPSPQTCDPAASSKAPTASAANGADVAAIKRRGYLTVGVAADQYLTGYLASGGAEEGFDIDLAYAVAKSLFGAGYQSKVRFVAISTDKRIPDLQSHQVDLVIDTMTITCDRLTKVDFSAVYYEASQKLLVESGSHYASLADLGGRKVCAQTGSTSISLIQAAASKPIAYQVTDVSDCLVLLQQNQVSAISTDDTILAGLAKQDPNLSVVGQALEPEPYGVAMPLGETDLEEYVNGVLAQYESSGGWAASYNHWLAGSLGPANPPVARYSD